MSDTKEENDVARRLRGRAAYLRKYGAHKSAELMDEAATALEAAMARIDELERQRDEAARDAAQATIRCGEVLGQLEAAMAVPREPTEAMLRAAESELLRRLPQWPTYPASIARVVWATMYAAARSVQGS